MHTLRSIPEVLLAIGWPLGTNGRTACPLHRGSNPSAFSYVDHGYTCFAGCGGGGVRDLAEQLGLQRPRLHIPHLQGLTFPALPDGGGAPTLAPRPSARLLEALEAKQRHVYEVAVVRHQGALRCLTYLDRVLQGTHSRDEAQFLWVAGWWQRAQQTLDWTHGIFARMPGGPCACRG